MAAQEGDLLWGVNRPERLPGLGGLFFLDRGMGGRLRAATLVGSLGALRRCAPGAAVRHRRRVPGSAIRFHWHLYRRWVQGTRSFHSRGSAWRGGYAGTSVDP